MINRYFIEQFKENFGLKLTLGQEKTIFLLADFLFLPPADVAFVLRGFAGTGKTSLVGALVRTLNTLKQKTVLMAPTGRAAKVFSQYAGQPAMTIHKKIYRQKKFSDSEAGYLLSDNLYQHTLFIVDEASMVANDGLVGNVFGSGRLLDDLIQYVYSGQGCRLLLVGDVAQLPPIGEERSPALDVDVLSGYGLTVCQSDLTEVVRQLDDSGILYNATYLRSLITSDDIYDLPKVRFHGFADICNLSGNELIETLNDCYGSVGMGETIVLCRSNKRANIYNNGIRARILYREEELGGGDIVMVTRNNYFWGESYDDIDFIANGDIAVVRRVRRVRELYGFRFADVTLCFMDYENEVELNATVLLDTLQSENPALSRSEQERLFQVVLEDYADIPLKADRMKKMKVDPYYNALQLKYAYAITCHKAQGGQWKKVFVDQGYMTPEMLTPDYFRWLYTAFTRATETLYLVNFPREQVADNR